jgi:uncharacterized protein (DUF433 family)
MATAPTQHIEVTPGVCGGRPRIAGHRIRVQDIYVWHERMGKSPDEIVSDFPQLTLADVYAALAYFWDHRDEILEDVKRQDEFIEEMKTKHPSILREKLKQMGRGDEISP